jgi:hypothetical protein
MPWESSLERSILAMSTKPLCYAANCNCPGEFNKQMDMAFCKGHAEYLELLHELIQQEATKQGFDESYVSHHLLQEARALAYPIKGIPRLVVLEGGGLPFTEKSSRAKS